MNIKCPQCDTLYDVSEKIANSGAQVQCAKCNDIFAATPAPEPEQATEIELDPVVEPQAEPLLEPVAQEVSNDGGSSDLLNEDEKAFFAGLVGKISEEEAAAEDSDTPTPEIVEAPAAELASDDIGWVEDDTDDQPVAAPIAAPVDAPIAAMEAETPIIDPEPIESPDLANDEDLFADADLQTEPETIEPLPQPVEELAQDGPAWRSKIPQLSRVHIGWGALAASVTFIIVAAATFRVPIVKAVPGMAGLYEKAGYPVNIRGLEFLGLNHQWMDKGGRMRLVVRGEIVNITDEAKPVPQILFSMIDQSGLEFFQWTEQAGPALLQPKARTRFRAQIPAPADRVRQLKIRFAKR